jgi:hypothetical protein
MIIWDMYISVVVAVVFFAMLFGGIRYVITDKQVLFKFFGLTGSCPLNQIVSIKRSYCLLSSPAASLKRIEIRFKKGYAELPFCFISPVREQEFLDTLKKHNPNINICVVNKKGWWRIWDWDI